MRDMIEIAGGIPLVEILLNCLLCNGGQDDCQVVDCPLYAYVHGED